MRTLHALILLSILGLSPGPTLRAQTGQQPDTRELPHAFAAGWQGQQTCDLLFSGHTVRVARCVFPPGVGHERHYHNPHFGYVLEGGTLNIVEETGAREVTTATGGSWSTTTVTVHEALNIGDSTTRYLIVEPVIP